MYSLYPFNNDRFSVILGALSRCGEQEIDALMERMLDMHEEYALRREVEMETIERDEKESQANIEDLNNKLTSLKASIKDTENKIAHEDEKLKAMSRV
ncbi:Aste57867_24867 [Aphanomyces stellatus]|uniref:Aste57867_24867 protein n=1 Tax=Aphanomyces stellatus TaxID=120398 RepID=A0A485LT08_9STRA|nr:hypothetical protein As57867_024789 [Aphanomyces stellatus]VFU01501.1 Aste57867_24867 [Aphanomyces stellatus]